MSNDNDYDIPESGAVFTFGRSRFAQNIPSHFFVRNDPVVEISCGDDHTALICESGRVFLFGRNDYGQLGFGHHNTIVKPSCLKHLKPFQSTHVACGKSHTIISTACNRLFTFGCNSDGQLGISDLYDRAVPQLVSTDFLYEDSISALAAGCHHSALLTEKGYAYLWGSNSDGQCGTEKVTHFSTPHKILFNKPITSISCGYYHTAFISLGCIYTFGEEDNGKLGRSRESSNYVPGKVEIEKNCSLVKCGGSHTMALTEDGVVYGFGSNFSGQMGILNLDTECFTPRRVEFPENSGKIVNLSCGESHSAFITDVIVRDSIIENKERTKSYWEQLMMAAAAENRSNNKIRVWDATDTVVSTSNESRNYKNSHNSEINSFSQNSANTCQECFENSDYETVKTCIKSNLTLNSLPMEDRIALELQEQRQREEELKHLRKQLLLKNSKEMICLKDVNNGNEELCSIHTNDDSNFSEYGSEEKEQSLDENIRVNTPYSENFVHQRTQSLDSVSSGLSSGSGSILNDKDSFKRKVMVRPYEDPQEEEEVLPYKSNENETPIEREIRIAKEREEELRREKGIYMNCKLKSEQPKVQKSMTKKDAVENDPRDVQHRLATNRIQYEIEEANERENELRTEGKILTTSEETVDAKVTRFTQLAEYAISQNRHKDSRIKKSSPVSLLMKSDAESMQRNNVTPIKVNELRPYKKYNSNPTQKGIMQRFIATKGKMSLPIINPVDQNIKKNNLEGLQLNPSSTYYFKGCMKVPSRKGYIPAGEKIQEELKEMEKREQELRLQRAYYPSMPHRHRSQPNLLSLSDDDSVGPQELNDEELHSWKSHKKHQKVMPRLTHSISNPNLLDDGLEKVNVRLPNKRFSLLQQWENRIQNAQ